MSRAGQLTMSSGATSSGKMKPTTCFACHLSWHVTASTSGDHISIKSVSEASGFGGTKGEELSGNSSRRVVFARSPLPCPKTSHTPVILSLKSTGHLSPVYCLVIIPSSCLDHETPEAFIDFSWNISKFFHITACFVDGWLLRSVWQRRLGFSGQDALLLPPT